MITLLTLGTFTFKCLVNASAPYEIPKSVQLKSSAHLENSEVRLECAHAILCKLVGSTHGIRGTRLINNMYKCHLFYSVRYRVVKQSLISVDRSISPVTQSV